MGGALINNHVKRFQPGYFSLPFFREPLIIPDSSLPPRIEVRGKLRRESSYFKTFWIPAFAGMTFLEVAFIPSI